MNHFFSFTSTCILFFATFLNASGASPEPEIWPGQVWDAVYKKPNDAKELKKLFDGIAKDRKKIRELVEMKQPLSTFLTQLASLRVTKDTVDMIEMTLEATKRARIANRAEQIRLAISELDPMCANRPTDDDNESWQKAIVALVRHARKFDICEWSEGSFIDAAIKYGNARDVRKILKAVASDWYTGELVSRLQENLDKTVADGAKTQRFIDIVLDYEPIRVKTFGITPGEGDEYMGATIRDEVVRRIKQPLDSDDPKLLKKILEIVDSKEQPIK